MTTPSNPFVNKILYHLPRLSKYVNIAAGHQPKFYPPIQVEIDLTNACVSACPWCAGFKNRLAHVDDMLLSGNSKHPAERLETSISRVRSLLDDLKHLGVKAVVWTGGGDPTSHRGLAAIMHHAHSIGLEQALITHGVIDVSSLVPMTIWTRFSVDASNANEYEKQHGRRLHFSLVLDNIRRSTENKGSATVGVAFITSAENRHDIIPFTKLWANYPHLDYIQYRTLQDTHGKSFFNDTQETQLQLQAAKWVDKRVVFSASKYNWISENDIKQTFVCHGQYLETSIAADSNVYRCCHLKGNPAYSIGNLNDESFQDVWLRHLQTLCDLGPFQTEKVCPQLCRHYETNRFIDEQILTAPTHPNFI